MGLTEQEIKERLVEINKLMTEALFVARFLSIEWNKIKWESIDKDNMEFKATVTAFQLETINELLGNLVGDSTT